MSVNTKQGVKNLSNLGNGRKTRKVKIVKTFQGGLKEVMQILCGMDGHVWKCRYDSSGKDICAKCALEDACEHSGEASGS